ncbi:MAG: hypothetical protein IKU13_10295 [Clostridia bacterium]|nr:hypothetical protein [Clostridia bacterium]
MNTIKLTGKTKMVAHRGLSGIERENTNPAFVAAGNRSYWGIETDVHKTSDGQFVIIHDETTERVTEGRININVEENPYDAVKDIVLPDKDGSLNRQDIRIPLLIDYIRICKKYEKIAVLELKNPFEEADIVKIIEIIKEEEYLDSVTFISFDLNNCIILRKLLPQQSIQWLTSKEIDETAMANLLDNNLDLDVYYKRLTKELIEKLHSHNIVVNCWTVDDKDAAEELIGWGVDIITSNILE